MEELAPELAPMLASIEMPANFVPLTNAVMAEMARRGVSRQQILTTLHNMGQELPEASVSMIKVHLYAFSTCIITPVVHVQFCHGGQAADPDHAAQHGSGTARGLCEQDQGLP